MPSVKEPISANASGMSRIKSAELLPDINGLSKYARRKSLLQTGGRSEIDRCMQKRGKVILKLKQCKIAGWTAKLDEKIDIARGRRFVPSHGPE